MKQPNKIIIQADGHTYSQDIWLILSLLQFHELQQALPKVVNLIQRSSKFYSQWNGFCQSSGTAHVQNEKGIQVTVRCLDDMTFHFLELGVQQRNLLDKIIVTFQHGASIAIEVDAISTIERMFDKNKNTRRQKFLRCPRKQPG